jgi:hypothetical protein
MTECEDSCGGDDCALGPTAQADRVSVSAAAAASLTVRDMRTWCPRRHKTGEGREGKPALSWAVLRR